jgi:hypothetical protein
MFYSYSTGMALIPSFDVRRFMAMESGTGVNLSFFLFFSDRSMQSGIESHYSFVTFANYLFKSTNLDVIEASI